MYQPCHVHAALAMMWLYPQRAPWTHAQGDGDNRAALERRIDEEVARVREAARADLATVREEARAALERETRLLRDMRDRAQHDADTAAEEVKACRQQLDDAAVRFRSLQHKADVQGGALAAELKIMAVDVDRAKVRQRRLRGTAGGWQTALEGGTTRHDGATPTHVTAALQQLTFCRACTAGGLMWGSRCLLWSVCCASAPAAQKEVGGAVAWLHGGAVCRCWLRSARGRCSRCRLTTKCWRRRCGC